MDQTVSLSYILTEWGTDVWLPALITAVVA